MPAFPTGLVTLVFTDIEGSSALWEEHRAAFAPVLEEHNRRMRAAAANHHGAEVKTEGDAFFLAFANAADAINYAVEAQLSLAAADWNFILPGLESIRVRIGMHSGTPILGQHPNGAVDYFGPVVNRAARVGGAGHGGQIIVSGTTRELALAALPSTLTLLDLGLHRLKGVGEETLWQVAHEGLPDRFPPLKTLSPQRHNLPPAATEFIGREREIETWSNLLREPSIRLLTLTGFGGQGKTRLSQQVAEQLVDDFPDGVWWVELETARDAGAMIDRIAHELRIYLQPQPTVREQLFNFHRERKLLLVLDNTEQIPEAGKVVRDLLAAAPGVKCLVTTRRALEIGGERLVEVPPLPTEQAVQLFAARAALRVEGFSLTPETRDAVARLCEALEGVPLAIELAASRVTVLSPGEILGRLDERFRLLQTRAPDLPARQRALRGAIDWSYELLTQEDRDLLAELAIFNGGFDLKAAEAISESFDILEGIAELRRHSLLRSSETGGNTRFSMLESVRAYAAEKLAELPERDGLSERHAAYFTVLVESLAGRLRGASEAAALDEFWQDRGNALAALEWSLGKGDAERAARLAVGLFDLLYRMGMWTEASSVVQRVLDVAPPLEYRSGLHLRRAQLAYDTGDMETLKEHLQVAHNLATGSPHRELFPNVLNLEGLVAFDAGELGKAVSCFRAAKDLRLDEDHNGRAIAFHNLARIASRRGDPEKARSLYEQALEARRAGGDTRGEAETLGNMGVLSHVANDLKTAADLYRHSLALRRTLRDRMGIALMLHNLGEIAEAERDFEEAMPLFVHAGRIFRELGSTYATAPVDALSRLQGEMGPEYTELLAEAGRRSWEEIVESVN